jgi:hypothetical protein
MKIGPYNQNQVVNQPAGQPPGAQKKAAPDGSREQAAPASPGGTRARPSQDSVQLSGADGAHRLTLYSRAGRSPVRVVEASQQTAGSEKLDRVRRRIESGFYDRPEVKQEIADRLAEEVTEHDYESGEFDNDYGIGDY